MAVREIMVVDDSAVVGVIFRRLFGRRGYQIRFYTTPTEALDYLKVARPVLVVLDINMPEVNGFDLCRRIKGEPQWSDLPVALFTAWDRPGDVAEGLRAGADYFLSKDLQDRELVDRVEEILRHASGDASAVTSVSADLSRVGQCEAAAIARVLERSFQLAVERNVTSVIGLEAARLIFARAADRVRKRFPFVQDMLRDGLWLDTSQLPAELTTSRRDQLMAGLSVFLQEMLDLLRKVTGTALVEKVRNDIVGHFVTS